MIDQNAFEGASLESLAAVIDSRVNKILGTCHNIQSVARGGEYLANSLDDEGRPTDGVSGGIFGSIVQTLDDTRVHQELRAAIRGLLKIADRPPASA